ncbi:PspC domain-containing protein, partial [Bifidobacterium adolescentis]
MPIQGFQLVFRADSGCSPIRMTAADCCNGDMSNANNNPQGGSAAGSAEPQSQPRPPMYQPQPNRGNRFFAWIRSSRITRGRNRWIAGVCDGVARRLGWNATLVRALVILTSLLFGAGAAFYALAWFLLPDETDGRILCEELVNGHWDWNCAGALVCAAVALCLPGAGWLAFGVAVLVFWLLVNRQSYAAS